jgi:hypothetical protein
LDRERITRFREIKTKILKGSHTGGIRSGIANNNNRNGRIRLCDRSMYYAIKEKKKFHFFAFYFRKILLAKLNYDIYDKELLAIVAAF